MTTIIPKFNGGVINHFIFIDREKAKFEGKYDLILRLLNRRIGEIDALFIERVRGLSIEKLENLGEALLDFSNVADKTTWLNQQEG